MGLLINIHSKGKYPANALSNFYPHAFRLDGVPISCMEAFLQSLKFEDPYQQVAVCQMEAKEAKALGSQQHWQHDGMLYWQGVPFSRYKKGYRKLLERAYDALCKNPRFAEALRSTGCRPLLHTIGKWSRRSTCLTWWELCGLLGRKRRKLAKQARRFAT